MIWDFGLSVTQPNTPFFFIFIKLCLSWQLGMDKQMEARQVTVEEKET
jgi:hypothetical protein